MKFTRHLTVCLP